MMKSEHIEAAAGAFMLAATPFITLWAAYGLSVYLFGGWVHV